MDLHEEPQMRQTRRREGGTVPEGIHRRVRLPEKRRPAFGLPVRGPQRTHDPIIDVHAVIFQQPQVRTQPFHPVKIRHRADERVRIEDEDAVLLGDVEQCPRLLLRETVVGPVVDPDVPGEQPRHQERARRVDRSRRPAPLARPSGQRMRAKAQPQREDAVGDQRIGAEGGDAQGFVVEAEHGDEQEAAGRERQRLAGEPQTPAAAKGRDRAPQGDERADRAELPQRLRREVPGVVQLVDEAGAGVAVDVRIDAAVDEGEELGPGSDRTQEIDRRRLVGTPHHPAIEGGRRERGDGDQVDGPAPEVPARAQGVGQEQGTRQNQQGIVVGEAEAVDRRRRYPQARAPRRRRLLGEGQGQEHRGGIGRVHVGDDRLGPEVLRDRQRRAGQPGGGPVAGAAQHQPGDAGAGERGHQAAQRVDPPGDLAERRQRGKPAEQDVQGISRRVRDAGEHRGGDEEAVVLQHHGARRGNGVERERAREEQRDAGDVRPRRERAQVRKRRAKQRLPPPRRKRRRRRPSRRPADRSSLLAAHRDAVPAVPRYPPCRPRAASTSSRLVRMSPRAGSRAKGPLQRLQRLGGPAEEIQGGADAVVGARVAGIDLDEAAIEVESLAVPFPA